MLLLVPFNDVWIDHQKIDIHAIYRRPHMKEDDYGEKIQETNAEGVPVWNLTTALPVKQHNRYRAKGYEYVTLANRDSLVVAAQYGTIMDQDGKRTANWKQYDQHAQGGPWNYKLYAMGQSQTTTREADLLKDDVARYGSEIVEMMRHRIDPNFTLPPNLRNVPYPQAPAAPLVEIASLNEPAAQPIVLGKAKAKGDA